jgi:predicted ATPase
VIDHLTIKGFKSFENVELNLGVLNFFIGTNSSGKSNLFDALRVLQGIGYGLRVDEIFNGKPKSGNGEVWEPIRGGGTNAGLLKWYPEEQRYTKSLVTLGVRGRSAGGEFDYLIVLSPTHGTVRRERLRVDGVSLFSISNEGRSREEFDRGKPVLSQIATKCTPPQTKQVSELLAQLADCRHLDPSPSVLRQYSPGRDVHQLGERGENFAALVETILADGSGIAYLSWLARMTPKDLDDVVILHGALGEPMFALHRRGRTFAAPILSDGTLRFAALTAAFFQPDMPRMLVLEEIENGIHPTRLRLLIELLRVRSSDRGPQVMASTHSPVIVDWLTTDDLEHCFFCRHDETTGVSSIQPLSSLPRFAELIKLQPAGELFSEGWMESSA